MPIKFVIGRMNVLIGRQTSGTSFVEALLMIEHVYFGFPEDMTLLGTAVLSYEAFQPALAAQYDPQRFPQVRHRLE